MPTQLYSNRLAEESSPYLLQHAHNPVDWYPWGEEAFEKAKKENKLLLISIGYSACHWCHVMERECFEDASVAALMNELYVCVKVDREEHPEVDHLYMDAIQIITGRGGWPLNCFVTPDGKPVYGGTYFPKEQWQQLLVNLNALYRHEPEKVKELCEEIEKGILTISLLPEANLDSPLKDFPFMEEFTAKIASSFDIVLGGYNYSPKFPMPTNYEYLLYYGYALRNMDRTEDAEKIETQVYLTLDKMAMGGIYDQAGGGFARYSTDSFWKAPHFEKMLYDNGQLMALYSNAYRCSNSELYKEVVYGIHNFISAQMTSPEGGFYSAMDADSEGREGEYYIWKKEELQQLIGSDFPLFGAYYSITEKDVWEDGKFILFRKTKDEIFCEENNMTLEDLRIKKAKWIETLMERRQKRLAPGLDDKILTCWNGLMLKGYTEAYKTFKEPVFLEAAIRNARFIKSKLMRGGNGLWHTYKNGNPTIPAFLDSYAFAASAFISLYEATLEEEWLNLAEDLVKYAIEHHYDEALPMFYFTSKEQDSIIVRKTEVSDNVIPASNSEMAIVLFKLGHYFGKDEYIHISKKMLSVISDNMLSYPQGYTNWGILMLHIIVNFYEVSITGKLAHTFKDRLCKEYLPNMVLMGAVSSSGLEMLKDKFVTDRTLLYICQDKTCLPPFSSTGEAINAIKVIK